MNIKSLVIIILTTASLLMQSAILLAQNVGINDDGSEPDNSAILDLKCNNKGLLVPRLTGDEIEKISNPATGLILYNIEEDILLYYNGANWQKIYFDCWPQVPTANAGEDKVLNDGTSVTLTANTPETEHGIGQWSVISGTGGVFEDESNPNTLFTGVLNETYTLQWEISTVCGSSTDEVTVEFNETMVVEVTNPTTGKIWMDRNLGASQVATSSDDDAAYGDLYQWGRGADGHQSRTSNTTTVLSSEDIPGHGDFITTSNSPNDWRSPQNDNLWQGVSGMNNPCPASYRLPTEAEWEAERESWSSNNATGAFASPLKLPVGGNRAGHNGSIYYDGFYGYYWSSTLDAGRSRFMFFYTDAYMGYGARTNGVSVRCIKD